MVNSLKQRLHKAAMVSGKTELVGSPLVRLHSGASPTAVFELDWPKDARTILSDANPSPMKIHYVRIEETMNDRAIKKVLDHYRARTRGSKREITTDVSLDGTLKSTSTGGRISGDVVITKSNNGGGGEGGATGTGYTIEVIAVQVPDPKPTKTAMSK